MEEMICRYHFIYKSFDYYISFSNEYYRYLIQPIFKNKTFENNYFQINLLPESSFMLINLTVGVRMTETHGLV